MTFIDIAEETVSTSVIVDILVQLNIRASDIFVWTNFRASNKYFYLTYNDSFFHSHHILAQ